MRLIVRNATLVQLAKGGPSRGGEGSRGGHLIGHTRSGRPIYAHTHPETAAFQTAHKGWTSEDHVDAAGAHTAAHATCEHGEAVATKAFPRGNSATPEAEKPALFAAQRENTKTRWHLGNMRMYHHHMAEAHRHAAGAADSAHAGLAAQLATSYHGMAHAPVPA